jgi:hypothetical protein
VVGPTTGNLADADPAHRHGPTLPGTRAEDHLLAHHVLEIEWVWKTLPFVFPVRGTRRLP